MAKSKRKRVPRTVLKLPDLEHSKSAVLNSLTSSSSKRSYDHAIREFIDWYCSEPRIAFNRTVVTRYRIALEQHPYAPSTINLRLAAIRRLAYEASDCGLLSPDLAAGIRRVKGVRRLGVRVGNWLTAEEGKKLLCTETTSTLRGLRNRGLLQGNFVTQKELVPRYVHYVIRTPRAGSASFFSDSERAVWSVNHDLPLAYNKTIGELYTKSMARTSFTLVLLSVAGAMTLLLGIIGLYGVIAYAISQHTREIGIRMALGAQPAALTRMYIREGLLLTMTGVIGGVAVALTTMRLMSSLLYHVSPVDPWTYFVATVSILIVACIATYVPSQKAAIVDPVHALRAE